jgi:N6-adenosine-specific RNA methylase IME4
MKFGTIIADPPWDYQAATRHDKKTRGYVAYRDGEELYPTLKTKDLCKLPIADLAADNAVLLLWTTGPFVPDALEVVRAWGFTFKTMVYWGKLAKGGAVHRGGVGYWFRGACEPVIVASRGKSVRTGEPGLYLSEKTRHSAKPNWLHEVSERHFSGPYLELFGRRERENWTVLGNEAPGDGLDIRVSVEKYCDSGTGSARTQL